MWLFVEYQEPLMLSFETYNILSLTIKQIKIIIQSSYTICMTN